MTVTFRGPLILRQLPRWPYEALFAQIDQSNALRYPAAAAPAPFPGNVIDPVRFIASSVVAVNAQEWLNPSSLELYLSSLPISTQVSDPVRFIANPLVGINSQWWLETSSQELFLSSKPVSTNLSDPVRFVTNPLVAINAQEWLNPSSLELYLSSTALSTRLVDPIRYIANPLVGVNSQWWLEASSQELFLNSSPISTQLTDVVRFIANPLVAINAQAWLDPSSLELYLSSNPIIVNWPPDIPQRVVQQPSFVMGSPLTLLSFVGLPTGAQSYDLRIVPNPWTAITAQPYLSNLNLTATPPQFPSGHQWLDLLVQPNPWIALRSQPDQGPTNPNISPPAPPVPTPSGGNYLRRLIQSEYYRERRLMEEGKFDRDQLAMYAGMTREQHIADLEQRYQRLIDEDDEEILRMIDP